MESVEKFARRYMAEHIAEETRQQAGLEPFRRKFYTANCVWSSRPGTLECFQSESIEDISSSDDKAELTTRRVLPLSETYYFLRYHLETSGDSWIISQVDLQCCPCGGKPGNNDCQNCHGTGWLNTNLAVAKMNLPSQQPDAKKVTA